MLHAPVPLALPASVHAQPAGWYVGLEEISRPPAIRLEVVPLASGRLSVEGEGLACEVGVLDRVWRPLSCADRPDERVLARVRGGVLSIRAPGEPDAAYVKANPLAVAMGAAWGASAAATPGAALLAASPDAVTRFADAVTGTLGALGHAPTGARRLGSLRAWEWDSLVAHLTSAADTCAMGQPETDAPRPSPADGASCLRARAADAGVLAVVSTLVLDPAHGQLLGDLACTPAQDRGAPRPLASMARATATAVPPVLLLDAAPVAAAPVQIDRDTSGRAVALSWRDTPITAWSYTPVDATPTHSVVFRWRHAGALEESRFECR